MKKDRLLNAIGQIDDRLIADAKPEVRVKQKRMYYRRIALVAACLVLVLCLGVLLPVGVGNREMGTITMEINPGVEFTVTRNGNVKSVRFLNDDAKNALAEVPLKGQSLKTAVSLTISVYKTVGFMEKNDTVLISFDKKLSGAAKFQKAIAEDVQKVLESTKAVHTVVYVSATDSAEVANLAEKYDISQGKAKLIEAAAKNTDFTVDELVTLPLDELVGLQKDALSVVIDTKYIGMAKAKAIALADAGCTTRVEFTEAVLVDGGVKYPYYHLVFHDKNMEWTYDINATNGDILKKGEVVRFLSLEEAREIVLKDAGLLDPSIKVIFTREELSRNQGRPCWILEFYTAKYQYFYKVDAKTGEIFYFEYHMDVRQAKEIALKDAGVFESIEKVTFTVEEYVGGGIKTPYFYFVFHNETTEWSYRIDATIGSILWKNEPTVLISLQKAKEIALTHAGITDASEVTFTKEMLNRSQGCPCWVLEFFTEKYQYYYEINAENGEVWTHKRFININKAKEIAVADAGCSEDKVWFTEEQLVDGGIKTPYFYFVFHNETTEWTYRIDATSGAIMWKNEVTVFISLQKAKEIALTHAGITNPSEVTFTKEELSRNQGRPCWVLEFFTEKYQYFYKVDAKTGEVMDGIRYLGMAWAREIALQDAGVESGSKVVFVAAELVDGGIKTPYYYFVFHDEQTQWTYRIDATNGNIIAKAKEQLKVILSETNP